MHGISELKLIESINLSDMHISIAYAANENLKSRYFDKLRCPFCIVWIAFFSTMKLHLTFYWRPIAASM